VNSVWTRSRLLGVALVAASVVAAGCGGNATTKPGATRSATVATLGSCFRDAGATKAAGPTDLAFAARDVAAQKYATAGTTRVAGTQVDMVQSLSHPGYALFIVAKPGVTRAPALAAELADPTKTAGVYFIHGDNPQYNRLRTCLS
jgi:hypothetical protein